MNIFLISQAFQDICVNLSYGISDDLVYGTFGVTAVLAGVAVVAGGAKAVINSKGIKNKKKEASVKADKLEEEIGKLEDIEFTNAYEGMEGASYDPKQAQLAELKKRAEYGDPAQREA